MMLLQLHWQYIENGKTVKTEMRAQREISSNDGMRTFVKETQENYPLPAKAIWMACNEKSEHFVMMGLN